MVLLHPILSQSCLTCAQCREKLLDMAAKATWDVLTTESYGISQQIEHCAHQALCSVYEAREQERVALHLQQQQRYQMELKQYNAYYNLPPGQQQQKP